MCNKCSHVAPATGSQPPTRNWLYVPAVGAYPGCLLPWPGLEAVINGTCAWLSDRRESGSRGYGPTDCVEAVCSNRPELKGLVAPLPPSPPATLTAATCRYPPPFLAALPPPSPDAVLRWLGDMDPSAPPPPPPNEDDAARHWLARISSRLAPPVYSQPRRRCRVLVPHYRGLFRRRVVMSWRRESLRRRRRCVLFPWVIRRLYVEPVIGPKEKFLGFVSREGSASGCYHRRGPHLLVFSSYCPWYCGF